MNWSIILWYKPFWSNILFNIVCAVDYLSTTSILSGVGILLAAMSISPSDQISITSTSCRISLFSVLFTISGALCSFISSMSPLYSSETNKCFIGHSWGTFYYLKTPWKSISGKYVDEKQHNLASVNSLSHSPGSIPSIF